MTLESSRRVDVEARPPSDDTEPEVSAEGVIDRRRFVAFLGAAGIVGTAGCIGDEEPVSGEGEGSQDDEDDGNDESADPEREPDEEFDFPPGASESGVVVDTLLAGAREFLVKTGRYRVTHEHRFAYPDPPNEGTEITYDVDERAVHERQAYDDFAVDRWITPEETVARSVETDGDRTDRWRTDTVDPVTDTNRRFNQYPFEETTVPALFGDTSFEFDEILTEEERSYARYSGDVLGSGRIDLPDWNSARIHHRFESVSTGSVSMLIDEDGAIHAVEYELVGEVARSTRDDRDVGETEVSGEVRFEYDDLEELTAPEWTETADSDEVYEFAVKDRSPGRVYEFVRGETLPGTTAPENAEFYVTAHRDGEQYIARYTPQMAFEIGDRVFADFDDEFVLDWRPVSGRNALEEADRIEMSVYRYHPRKRRIRVFHENFYPQQFSAE